MTESAASVAPSLGAPLAIALAVLVAVGVTASLVGRVGIERNIGTAAVRAIAQLSVVSLVIRVALNSLALAFGFTFVMFAVATATSARRIGSLRSAPYVAAAIGSGVVPVLAILLVSRVIPLNGAGLVPTAGIVIGGAMTANTLAGRRAFDELRSQLGVYEAGLALGLPSAQSALEVVLPSSREALTPALDQTRTVGLVTLPGAYVGVLLGGGSAVQAGAAQVMVLIGLLAAETVTAVVLLRFVAFGRVVRPDLAGRFPR